MQPVRCGVEVAVVIAVVIAAAIVIVDAQEKLKAKGDEIVATMRAKLAEFKAVGEVQDARAQLEAKCRELQPAAAEGV